MALPCGHSWNEPPIAGCNHCRIRDNPFHRARWVGPPAAKCVHLGNPTGESRIQLNCLKDQPTRIPTFACAVHGTCTEGTPARETECCKYCSEKELGPAAWIEESQAPPDAEVIDHGAGGIGDGLLGLLAVAKRNLDNPAAHIHYRVSSTASPFVALFHGYDSLGRSAKSHTEAMLSDGAKQLNVGYTQESRARFPVSRWERYARNAGTEGYLIPPLRDFNAIRELGRDAAGCVLLCPFSTDRMREWSLHHWQTFEGLLLRAGYQVRFIHDRAESPFRSPKLIGDAPRLAGAMLNAIAAIGTDSGMAHLGGILGVPTIVLGGSTPVSRIFGAYPRVACIQGQLDCSGCCGGTGVNGLPLVTDRCRASCSNLQAITPEQVLSELDRVWLKMTLAKDRSLLWQDRLAGIRNEVLATNGLAGDVAELGVYLGGSAKIIGHYAKGCRLHLFDTFAGIPADDQAEGGHHVKGEFRGDLADVRAFLDNPAAMFHVGEFPASVPGNDLQFRFVHVDADTYQSTKASLEYFVPRMTPGGVMLFDDFGWWACPGVGRAIHEAGLKPERSAEYQGRVRF